MFWDKWIPNKYLIKSTICGLEVLHSDSGIKFRYTILKKQSNKLQVVDSGTFDNLSEIPKRIEKEKIPLILNFTGKGIINRKLNFNSDEELMSDDFIHQHFPSSSGEDFCTQIIKQKNNTCFVSLIRKSQLDSIIQEIKKLNHDVAGIIIGPASSVFVLNLISNRNLLNTGSYKLEILNDNIETITNIVEPIPNEQIEMDGLKINSLYLLSFASAFSYLTFQAPFKTSERNISSYGITHLERNKLRTARYFFVALTFFISITNFLFFNNYYSESNKMQSELDIYEGKYDQINELLSNYEKKKGLIEQTGLLEGGLLAKYADKIAGTIPEEVILTEFYFNPELKNNTEEDSLKGFQKNIILIKGNCDKSFLVNEWVSVLKSQSFIKEVNLEQFLFKNEGNQPNFIIKVATE